MLEKKPLQGFLLSFMIGLFVTVIGGLLSVILIGIPILIAGVMMMLASPITAFMVKFGECPNCQASVYLIGDSVKCRKCKFRLTVTDNELELV